jgi:hypothetical protein
MSHLLRYQLLLCPGTGNLFGQAKQSPAKNTELKAVAGHQRSDHAEMSSRPASAVTKRMLSSPVERYLSNSLQGFQLFAFRLGADFVTLSSH